MHISSVFSYSVTFSTKTTTDHPTYAVSGNPIKQLLQHKDLGMTFSIDLNWVGHYEDAAKAYQSLGLIRCTFKTSCIKAKKQL